MNRIGAHSENTGMIGDRMDTDVVAGIEAGLHTVLVLSGGTRREDLDNFAYRPEVVVESIAELGDLLQRSNWRPPIIKGVRTLFGPAGAR